VFEGVVDDGEVVVAGGHLDEALVELGLDLHLLEDVVLEDHLQVLHRGEHPQERLNYGQIHHSVPLDHNREVVVQLQVVVDRERHLEGLVDLPPIQIPEEEAVVTEDEGVLLKGPTLLVIEEEIVHHLGRNVLKETVLDPQIPIPNHLEENRQVEHRSPMED